jgi:hypothetical protein
VVIRTGSERGPAWMRELSLDPRRLRRAILRMVIFFGVLQVLFVVLGDMAVYRAPGKHVRSYSSQIPFARMPLLSKGGRAHGIIAYGGLSVGLLGFGGLTMGVIVLGAGAVGWRAMGEVAMGQAAFGARALRRYAYAGPGVALGRDEASGQQRESLSG